jgi:hypothetical protein
MKDTVHDLDSGVKRPRPSRHVTVSLYIYQPHAATNNSLLLSNHHHQHIPPNQTYFFTPTS